MPVTAYCSRCQKNYPVAAGANAGRCPRGHSLKATASALLEVPEPEAPPARSGKGGALLLGGLLALLLGGTAFAIYLALSEQKPQQVANAGGNTQSTERTSTPTQPERPSPPEENPPSEEKPPLPPSDEKPLPTRSDEGEPVGGGSKLDLRSLNKLDSKKLDAKIEPPKEEEPTPSVWEGHTNHVRCLAFTSDGALVLSVSGDASNKVRREPDNSICVWDARTGKVVHKMAGFKEALNGLSVAPGGGFALLSYDGHWKDGQWVNAQSSEVFLWNIQSKRAIGPGPLAEARTSDGKDEPPPARFQGLGGSVFTTAISPKLTRVAAADNKGALILWDTETGKLIKKAEVKRTRGSLQGSYAVRFSPDGELIVVASADYTLQVFRADTGEPIGQPLDSHTDIVWCLALANDSSGKHLALSAGGYRQNISGAGFEQGSKDFAVRLWDLDRGQVIGKFPGHTSPVMAVAFCPDGRRFVSAGFDKTVRLWDTTGNRESRILGRHDEEVRAVAIAPDGRSCVTGGHDCKIRHWRIPHVKDLGEALAKKDKGALRSAITDIDFMGPDAAQEFPTFVALLAHEDREFAELGVKGLGQMASVLKPKELPYDRTHVKTLLDVVKKSPSTEGQLVAIAALGTIGPDAREALPALTQQVRDGSNPALVTASIQAMRRIDRDSTEVQATIKSATSNPDARVRLAALSALAADGMGIEEMLVRMEIDTSTDVRAMLETTLRGRFRDLTTKDVPVLTRGLKKSSSQVNVCCADGLASLKDDAAAAVPELLALARNSQGDVQQAARRALVAICGAESGPALAPTEVTAEHDKTIVHVRGKIKELTQYSITFEGGLIAVTRTATDGLRTGGVVSVEGKVFVVKGVPKMGQCVIRGR